MLLGYLTTISAFVYVVSHILLMLISVQYLNWKLARSKGVLMQLLVLGGYRQRWALGFVENQGKYVMAFLDNVRHKAIVAVFVLLPVYMFYGWVINA